MAQDYPHSVRGEEINEGTRTVNSAIVWLVCIGGDADAATFLLNRPVLLTDVLTATARPGNMAHNPARCRAHWTPSLISPNTSTSL